MTRLRTRAQIGAVTAVLAAGALTVPGSLAAHAAVTAPIDCPDAFPTADAVDGVTGTGFTVERGTTPQPFSATVLGRVTDGIAPGVDMILADLSSPAITRAGGVWAGMSGSPVYTQDGRLIGSVSYGLAPSSPIAGITPASEMFKLLDLDAAQARAAAAKLKDKVAVGKATAQRLARTGDVTAAEAQAGFSRLRLPVTVSGAGAGHNGKEFERLRRTLPDAVITTGSAAPGTAAAPSEISAGSNFAATWSYGTATIGGVGTTTFVCDGQAVAFGHPAFFTGADATETAHPATAVVVQPDPLFGPFKVANIGGIAGTIDQDRLAGLRAHLGQQPATAPITTNFRVDGGPVQTLKTQATAQPFMADITFSHVIAAVDRNLDKIGPGSADVILRVRGVRADGSAFTVSRGDKISDTGDISYALAVHAADFVYSLTSQDFEDIRITSVTMGGALSSKASDYRVSAFKVRSAGTYIPVPNPINVREGGVLTTQFTLRPYRGGGALKTVDIPVAVPRGSGNGFGSLDVAAGQDYPASEPSSFAALLTQLRSTPGPDSLRVTMRVTNTNTGRTVTTRVTTKADRAVVPWENSYEVSSTP
jgi:hypothetical protein